MSKWLISDTNDPTNDSGVVEWAYIFPPPISKTLLYLFLTIMTVLFHLALMPEAFEVTLTTFQIHSMYSVEKKGRQREKRNVFPSLWLRFGSCFGLSCSGNLLRFQPDSITNKTFPRQSFHSNLQNLSVARFQEQRKDRGRDGESNSAQPVLFFSNFLSVPKHWLTLLNHLTECLCLNLSSFSFILSSTRLLTLFLVQFSHVSGMEDPTMGEPE